MERDSEAELNAWVRVAVPARLIPMLDDRLADEGMTTAWAVGKITPDAPDAEMVIVPYAAGVAAKAKHAMRGARLLAAGAALNLVVGVALAWIGSSNWWNSGVISLLAAVYFAAQAYKYMLDAKLYGSTAVAAQRAERTFNEQQRAE